MSLIPRGPRYQGKGFRILGALLGFYRRIGRKLLQHDIYGIEGINYGSTR